MMGESTAMSESLTRPMILTSATISGELRAVLRLDTQYSDWEVALALARACVLLSHLVRNMQAGSSRRLELRRMHA